jgi:hypothetical protein
MGARPVTVRFAVTRMKTLDRKATASSARLVEAHAAVVEDAGFEPAKNQPTLQLCKPASVIVHGRTFNGTGSGRW